MNFDINGFFKFFGSIYKIAFILFLCGLFLILANKELLAQFYLTEFINQYGVYVGIVTLFSGVITALYLLETIFSWIKSKYQISKSKTELIQILKDLSIQEKHVFAHFLANKTQTSNLGIEFESFQESQPIKTLLAKGYIQKGYVGVTPHYYVNTIIWDVLQANWQEIFYEDEFHNRDTNEK